MKVFEKPYNGFLICGDSDGSVEVFEDNESIFESDNYDQAIKRIDKMKKKEFKRIPIFKFHGNGDLFAGEITSIVGECRSAYRETNRIEFWISYKDKYGSQRRLIRSYERDGVCTSTKSNKEKAKKIKHLVQKRDIIESQIEEIKKEMERISDEDLNPPVKRKRTRRA